MSNLADELVRIQNWYLSQCDGDWEHANGVTITTLDNPGWSVLADLKPEGERRVVLEPVIRERNEDDWVNCSIADGRFIGYGGPSNLVEILGEFLDLVSIEEN